MGTGRITFYRERPRQDLRRSYRILVDGGEIGTLEHSGSLSIDLPEGPHTGQARIDGTGSPEQSFDVLARPKPQFDQAHVGQPGGQPR